MLSFIKSKLNNKSLAEDILQEVFIKAFKKYDDYVDRGKLKGWLMRIAYNAVRDYFDNKENRQDFLSLDDEVFNHEANLYSALSNENALTPDEIFIQKTTINEIMQIIAELPKAQQDIISLRLFQNLSVTKVAVITGLPEGTVKSKTHYAIHKIKKELGIAPQTKEMRGNFIMNCSDIYEMLFMYAKGTIQAEDKVKVYEHIKNCKKCADIVFALKRLIPAMTFAKDDETSHFLISFPDINIEYVGVSSFVDSETAEQLNKQLSSWNGKIPDTEEWGNSGHGSNAKIAAVYDNEGNRIEVAEYNDPHISGFVHVRNMELKKVFSPVYWNYTVYRINKNSVVQSKEDPNLHVGHLNNTFGQCVKSALYQAIPKESKNIRIRRGNGLIDCDTYSFAYVDRYVAEDEKIVLEYTYLNDCIKV